MPAGLEDNRLVTLGEDHGPAQPLVAVISEKGGFEYRMEISIPGRHYSNSRLKTVNRDDSGTPRLF